MMRKSWKAKLQEAFEAPAPLEKEEFLRKLDRPRMGLGEFLFSQAAYINKWSRLASSFVYSVAVTGAVA